MVQNLTKNERVQLGVRQANNGWAYRSLTDEFNYLHTDLHTGFSAIRKAVKRHGQCAWPTTQLLNKKYMRRKFAFGETLLVVPFWDICLTVKNIDLEICTDGCVN